jgi:hypothetical protein
MQFKYEQSTGRLYGQKMNYLATGYSGHGDGLNNTQMEGVKMVGPIPRGEYKIGLPYNSAKCGKFCLPLTPVGHDALKRTALLAHGDNKNKNKTASNGCIILPYAIRVILSQSPDSTLLVY